MHDTHLRAMEKISLPRQLLRHTTCEYKKSGIHVRICRRIRIVHRPHSIDSPNVFSPFIYGSLVSLILDPNPFWFSVVVRRFLGGKEIVVLVHDKVISDGI